MTQPSTQTSTQPGVDDTIVLMGLRGSGKTTLGKRLAAALGRPFVDLDDRTAASLNHATSADALRAHGLDAFRRAETEALRAVLDPPGNGPGRVDAPPPAPVLAPVLALGGGTPTAPGAADLLREHAADGRARLVYLRASPETLTERLRLPGAPERPALIASDPVGEVRVLFEQRDPLYRELAGAVLHLDAVSEDSAAAMLAAWAEENSGAHRAAGRE